jgi:hypothetical protein
MLVAALDDTPRMDEGDGPWSCRLYSASVEGEDVTAGEGGDLFIPRERWSPGRGSPSRIWLRACGVVLNRGVVANNGLAMRSGFNISRPNG